MTTSPRARSLPALLAPCIMGLAALAAVLMLWGRREYVAIWDGRIYADCVIDASQNLFAPGGYRCAGHISQSYVALLALAQSLAPASPVPMLAMNMVLLALGGVAMYRLTRQLFPGEEHRVPRALVVAAFLMHPVVLGSAMQPGLDFGMLVFATCTLAAVIEGRRWAVVVFGVMLVFSKEPGVLVYGVIAVVALWRDGLRRLVPSGAWLLGVVLLALAILLSAVHADVPSAVLFAALLGALLLRRERPSRVPVVDLLRCMASQWTLAVPLLLVFGYMGSTALRGMFATTGAAAPVVWNNASAGSLVATVFRTGVIDLPTLAALALILVVSFMWVPTLLAAVDALVGATRRARALPPREMPGVDGAALGFVLAALLGELWFLTRFVTYTNARYYLPVYPLLLIAGYAALVRLGVSRTLRSAALGALVVLFGISAVRTIDPVSRALWGTFAVGDRSMLVVTSLTGECCGAGRDQLVYNLEFTRFGQLTSDAFARIRPTDSTAIVVPVLGEWYTVGQVDSVTRRRTLARHGVLLPHAMTAAGMYYATRHPKAAWYLELPYLDNALSLQKLDELYDVGPPAFVVRDGYAMAVRRLHLRATPAAPVQPAPAAR